MVAAGEEAESLSAAPSLANVSAPLVSGHVGTGSMSSIPATHNPLDKAPKRVMLIANAVRKFLKEYQDAWQQEMAAASAGKGGKKKGGKKKGGKTDDGKDDKDGGKKKKNELPPRTKAWLFMFHDIDNLINKDKKASYDDIHRALGVLTDREQQSLHFCVLGVTPKTFPSHDIGSENVMIVKNMLFASSAAYDYRKDKSRVIITTFGPTTMRACGVPVEKGLEVGCPVATLVRAGYTVQDVASKSYDLAALRGAGAMVVDLLQIHELYLSGHGGAGRLRAAGYSAAELKECGTFTAWDMRQAGYSLDELRATGYSPAELRMAGFGDADAQPPDLLRHTVRPLQGTDVTALPRWLSGTSDPNIRAQIQAKVQATAQQGKGGGLAGGGSGGGGSGARGTPSRTGYGSGGATQARGSPHRRSDHGGDGSGGGSGGGAPPGAGSGSAGGTIAKPMGPGSSSLAPRKAHGDALAVPGPPGAPAGSGYLAAEGSAAVQRMMASMP